jgi:hypothetical protein
MQRNARFRRRFQFSPHNTTTTKAKQALSSSHIHRFPAAWIFFPANLELVVQITAIRLSFIRPLPPKQGSIAFHHPPSSDGLSIGFWFFFIA